MEIRRISALSLRHGECNFGLGRNDSLGADYQTSFGKIFQAYAIKEGKDLRSLRFLHEGNRLLPDGTPEEVSHYWLARRARLWLLMCIP